MKNINKNIKRTPRLPVYFPILLLSLLLVILTSCVLSPIYTQVENDVTIMYTPLPMILDYVIIIFETLYISLLFSTVAYSVYASYKGEESRITSIIFIVAVVFLKHTLNLTASSIIDSYIDVAFDIPVTIMLFLADLLMLFIVWIVAMFKSQKHFSHAKKMQKASKYLNTVEYNEEAEIYPFKGIRNIKNTVLFPIFVGSVISASLLIVQRLYADLFVLGFPTSFYEVVEIVISYISDILLGIIGYIAAYFATSFIFVRRSLDNESDLETKK